MTFFTHTSIIASTQQNENIFEPGLIVIDFFATWCGPCKQIAPAYHSLAMTMPICRFVTVDVDECDKLSQSLKVSSMPTFKIYRGTDCLFTIVGGGPEAISKIKTKIIEFSSDTEKTILKNWEDININGVFNLKSHMNIVNALKTEGWQMNALATRPLAVYQTNNGTPVLNTDGTKKYIWNQMLTKKTRTELGQKEIIGELPFDLSTHPHARSVVAKSMLKRMAIDIKWFANKANLSSAPKIKHLLDDELNRNVFVQPLPMQATKEEKLKRNGMLYGLKSVLVQMKQLTKDLKTLRDSDVQYVAKVVPLLLHAANYVDIQNEKDFTIRKDKIYFLLRRQAGQESKIWLEYLFGCLLSSKALEDLQTLNPYLTDAVANSLLKVVTATLLRSNRIGQSNRCIEASVQLHNR